MNDIQRYLYIRRVAEILIANEDLISSCLISDGTSDLSMYNNKAKDPATLQYIIDQKITTGLNLGTPAEEYYKQILDNDMDTMFSIELMRKCPQLATIKRLYPTQVFDLIISLINKSECYVLPGSATSNPLANILAQLPQNAPLNNN